MDKTIEISNNETRITHLLKPKEVAEILGISRSHIYCMLQLGVIPNVVIGKCRRVRLEDLVKFIENNTFAMNR